MALAEPDWASPRAGCFVTWTQATAWQAQGTKRNQGQIGLFHIWKLALWGSHIQAGRCSYLAWTTESSDEQGSAVTPRASAEASAQAQVRETLVHWCFWHSLSIANKTWSCLPGLLHFPSTLLLCVLCSVWFFETPQPVPCQDPLSTEFSRQAYWSGLPFPHPGDLPDPGTEPVSVASSALSGCATWEAHLLL